MFPAVFFLLTGVRRIINFMMITFTLRIVLFQEITLQYVMPLVVLAVRFFLTLILNYLLDYFFF